MNVSGDPVRDALAKALRKISNAGAKFDARGTHSQWVLDVAREALAAHDAAPTQGVANVSVTDAGMGIVETALRNARTMLRGYGCPHDAAQTKLMSQIDLAIEQVTMPTEYEHSPGRPSLSSPNSGNSSEPVSLTFTEALKIAQAVFDQYKVDWPKWWKRMDGTPILNDVPVRIAVAFSQANTAPVAAVQARQEDEGLTDKPDPVRHGNVKDAALGAAVRSLVFDADLRQALWDGETAAANLIHHCERLGIHEKELTRVKKMYERIANVRELAAHPASSENGERNESKQEGMK